MTAALVGGAHRVAVEQLTAASSIILSLLHGHVCHRPGGARGGSVRLLGQPSTRHPCCS